MRWMLVVTVVVLAATACTGVDDAPDETTEDAATTTAAPEPPPTATAAPPTTTEAAGAEDGAGMDVEAEGETESEPLREEYKFDCGTYCLDETSGVVGVELAPGLWQWAANSRGNCLYIAVSPHPRRPDGSYASPVDDIWWLDARGPVVLAEGEIVLGFAPQPNHDEMVISTNPVRCFLERVGSYTSGIDVYAQRHGSERDRDMPELDDTTDLVGVDEVDSEADWTCYAHVGPEPATQLDWSKASPDDHAGVSCVVGEGIAAGWWRWHNPSDTCRYLVTQDADDPDRHRLRRRDASELLLLTAGESVWGYSASADDLAPFTISTTATQCILDFFGPERSCYAHAHTGAEPATELDWTTYSLRDHPDVSCAVGEGIAAGWWRWHNPSDTCRYLVLQETDDPDQLSRRDAWEPVLLTAGERVRGYSHSADDYAPFRYQTNSTECILQFVRPE